MKKSFTLSLALLCAPLGVWSAPQEQSENNAARRQDNVGDWHQQARAIVGSSTDGEDKVSKIDKWRNINASKRRSRLLRVASGEKSQPTAFPGSVAPSEAPPYAKDELRKEIFSFRSELGLQVRLIQMQKREPEGLIAALDELLSRASGALSDAQMVRSEIVKREKDKQSSVAFEAVTTTGRNETDIDIAAKETLDRLKSARDNLHGLSSEEVVARQSNMMNAMSEEMRSLRSKQVTERKLR